MLIPAWAVILVALVSFAGGLLAHVLKSRHDRAADLSGRAAETFDEIARAAESWITAVNAAIESRSEHMYVTDDSDPAVQAARATLSEGRTLMHRLVMVGGVGSPAVVRGLGFFAALEIALAKVAGWPPAVDDPDAIDDDEEYDAVAEAFEESCDEARMYLDMAREGVALFVKAANAEVERAVWPFGPRRRAVKGG